MLSKSSSERRVILFTGPSGVGKTAAVKHALRFLMNETSGLEGNPDVIVETLRGRALFFEEDVINLAITRNIVAKAGAKPDIREKESLTLLQATLIDVPYIIFLDDADDEGLHLVRGDGGTSRAQSILPTAAPSHTCARHSSCCPPLARDRPYSSRRRRWTKRT